MPRQMKPTRVLALLLGIALLVAAIGCSATAPNIDATVEARAKELVGVQPTPTPVVVVKEITPTDTPSPTNTPLPKPANTPEPTSTLVHAAGPDPASRPLPTLPPLSTVLEAMSPDLLVCVQTALGDDQYNAIISGRQSVPPQELSIVMPCLMQYPQDTKAVMELFGLDMGTIMGPGRPTATAQPKASIQVPPDTRVPTATPSPTATPTPTSTPTPIPTVTPTDTPIASNNGLCGGLKGAYLLMCQMMSQAPPKTSTEPFAHDAGPPVLQNLLIKNFGPYVRNEGTSGDFKLDRRFGQTVFDEFGRLHNVGQSNEYENPTFEYKLPADTQILVPIEGVVDRIVWQPTADYMQNDWEIFIKPSRGSTWIVVIDHIVSIDCDRSSRAICDLPLTINGQELQPGASVQAGQILGYVGNWDDQSGSEIRGRTELTIGEQKDDGFYNQCPTMMLADDVKEALELSVTSFMTDYESWSEGSGAYAQDRMVAPGCLFSTIKEVDGKTEPIR